MDVTTETRSIRASAALCYEVAIDFEKYPEWASDIRSVEVVSLDSQGRPLQVAYRAAAFGRSASYTLEYEYGEMGFSWRQVSGDVTSKLDGRYAFVESTPAITIVTYDLAAELVVPLPSFLKRRAEVKITRSALDDLARRVADLLAGGQAGSASRTSAD